MTMRYKALNVFDCTNNMVVGSYTSRGDNCMSAFLCVSILLCKVEALQRAHSIPKAAYQMLKMIHIFRN
jgi:hypothetical protein